MAGPALMRLKIDYADGRTVSKEVVTGARPGAPKGLRPSRMIVYGPERSAEGSLTSGTGQQEFSLLGATRIALVPDP